MCQKTCRLTVSGTLEENETVFTASSYLDFASDLSSRFVSASPDRMDDEIRDALRRIAGFFSIDYCAIYKSSNAGEDIDLVKAIDARHKPSGYPGLDVRSPAPEFFKDVLHSRQILCLHTADDFPAGAKTDRTWLADCGIKSLVLMPVPTVTPINYLFMLASVRDRHGSPEWSKKDVLEMRLLADIMVNAMGRSGAQKAFQRTARDLSEVQRIYRLGRWEWEVASGRIVELEAVDRILGLTPATQTEFVELVHAADRKCLQEAIDNVLSNDANELQIEYRIRTRRNDLRTVRSRFEVIQSESGLRMFGTFQDVTNARRVDQELQLLRSHYWHSDRVAHTGVLVASLAHELCQPLAAILSNAQAGLRFLSHEPLDQQEISDILNDIVADNQRARQVIDSLRGMLRRNKAERVRIDATDIARGVMALLHSEFVAQQVEVEFSCSGDCFVQVDKSQIDQVMLNLMLNSIDSMRAQSSTMRRIQLQVNRMDAEEVQVSVSDTGAGIPKDQLGNVFEAFWTTKAHGLGMGLAICRSILETHGGRIWAECNSDRGVTFLFRLPLVA